MPENIGKIHKALREARTQTRRGADDVWEFTKEIQTELWSRDYPHAWGTRLEFQELAFAHLELVDLPIKEAADLLLEKLPTWHPVLAQKESKARERRTTAIVPTWEHVMANRELFEPTAARMGMTLERWMEIARIRPSAKPHDGP